MTKRPALKITNITVVQKSYDVKTPLGGGKKAVGKRYTWDVQYTENGKVYHAEFSSEDDANRHVTRLKNRK